MTRRCSALMAASVFLLVASEVRGESGEKSFGLEASLLLPGFTSRDSTAFALTTWGLGAFGQYGLADDLYLQGRVTFASFDAALSETRTVRGRDLEGERQFGHTQVHLEVGGRYKLFAGYDLAPYVEVLGGYLWSVYRGQQFVNAQGQSFGLELADQSEGAMTLSVGLVADYRLLDLFFVGLGVRYVQVFGAMNTHYVSTPVQFSYYW